jgi:hypothetical protein
MGGDLTVEDFVTGVGAAEDYTVDRYENDGKYHLVYSADGARIDITMKDKDKVSPDGAAVAYAV